MYYKFKKLTKINLVKPSFKGLFFQLKNIISCLICNRIQQWQSLVIILNVIFFHIAVDTAPPPLK